MWSWCVWFNVLRVIPQTFTFVSPEFLYRLMQHYKLAYRTTISISTYFKHIKSYADLKNVLQNQWHLKSTTAGIKSVRLTNVSAEGLNVWSWKTAECGTWLWPDKITRFYITTVWQNNSVQTHEENHADILVVQRFLNHQPNRVPSTT